MIHCVIKEERRLTPEARYELRKAEAMKNPANVKWFVYVDLGLVKEVDEGEEFEVYKQDVQEFATEPEANAFAAKQDKLTTIEMVVNVPPDPYPPKSLALQINNDLRTQTGTDAKGMPVYQVTPRPAQLHSMGTRIDDESNITYAAEWDGKAPYVTVLKGDMADLRMAFMGWPLKTKEQWEAEQPEPLSV